MSTIKYLAILVSEETKDIVVRITTGYNLGNIPVKFIYVDHPKVLSVMKKTGYIKSVPALVASFVGVSEKSIYYDLKIFQVLSEISSRNTLSTMSTTSAINDQPPPVEEINYEPTNEDKVVNVGKIEGLGVGPSNPGVVLEEPVDADAETRRRKRKNYKVHTDDNTTLVKDGSGIPSTDGKSNAEIIEEMKKAREQMDREFKSRNESYAGGLPNSG